MRVFVTGSTGFIGSHVVPELLQAGHQVLGLTRSDEGADRLRAAGAEAYRGTLEEPASLANGAAHADAVIHLAFDHNFANFLANTEKDRRAVTAMGEELMGSKRPMIITSGVGIGSPGPGQLAREDVYDAAHPNPRKATEEAGRALSSKGVDVRVVRLPQVHDTHKQGLISPLIDILREKGASGYVGEGATRWAAAAVADVAHLYRLVLEKGEAGKAYNAVDEEGVSARDIAEALGRGLHLPLKSIPPEEAGAFFGWMGMFADMDLIATSAWTREVLDWKPTGPSLLDDLNAMDYSKAGWAH